MRRKDREEIAIFLIFQMEDQAASETTWWIPGIICLIGLVIVLIDWKRSRNKDDDR